MSAEGIVLISRKLCSRVIVYRDYVTLQTLLIPEYIPSSAFSIPHIFEIFKIVLRIFYNESVRIGDFL
jgi:hypothetical protein